MSTQQLAIHDNKTLGPTTYPKRHPFIDIDNVIEWDSHIVQRFPQAEKLQITGLEPGPGGACDARGTEAYGSVFYEDGRFRFWYSVIPDALSYEENADHYYIAYAESDDGMHWKKPDLGITAQQRFPGNNLLALPGALLSVVRGLPGAPAKYLAITGVIAPFEPEVHHHPSYEYNGTGTYLWGSDDGLEWRQIARHPIARHGDWAVLHADPVRNRYLFYLKVGALHGMTCRRSTIVMESQDAIHWEGYHGYRQWNECFVPDDYDDLIAAQRGYRLMEYYGGTLHQIGPLYLAVQHMIDVRMPLMCYAGQNPNGRFHGRLAFSHNGVNWRHPRGRPAFMEGGAPGSFDTGYFTFASNVLEHGDEQLFYYSGIRYDHGWCINPDFSIRQDIPLEDQRQMASLSGLAKIKRDRFASLGAAQAGRFDVEIGPRQGEQLTLNALSPRGRVRVAIAEQRTPLHLEPRRGEHLPGFSFEDCVPFSGDAVRHPVAFRGASITDLPRDTNLVLRFEVTEAEVFGYEWAD